jgi:hypothetical protein
MEKVLRIIEEEIQHYDKDELIEFKKQVLPLVWDEYSLVITDDDDWVDVFLNMKEGGMDLTEMISCVVSNTDCFPTTAELEVLLKKLLNNVADITSEICARTKKKKEYKFLINPTELIGLTGKIPVIEPKNEKQAKIIMKLAKAEGLNWADGDEYLEDKTMWEPGVCYNLYGGFICNEWFYKKKKYKIIKFSDAIGRI